jgi:hypothetical protein
MRARRRDFSQANTAAPIERSRPRVNAGEEPGSWRGPFSADLGTIHIPPMGLWTLYRRARPTQPGIGADRQAALSRP